MESVLSIEKSRVHSYFMPVDDVEFRRGRKAAFGIEKVYIYIFIRRLIS